MMSPINLGLAVITVFSLVGAYTAISWALSLDLQTTMMNQESSSPSIIMQSNTESFLSVKKKRENEVQSAVQRIYYLNLEKNVKRRELTEGWLQNQMIPFQRVNASVGTNNPEACPKGKQNVARCRGISGIIKTQLGIIRNYNTTGMTLVFEDDYVVSEPMDDVVRKTLAIVPADWDIIRWDCKGHVPSTFEYVIKSPHQKVFRTAHRRPCNETNETCWFCGGGYAMLWRDTSLQKLESIWSEKPYNDLDCRLTTDQLNSYCVDIGGKIGEHAPPKEEETDNPKLLE